MLLPRINLFPEQICGNKDGIAIALSTRAGYDYVDGKKTDNLTHYKLECVMIDNNYEKVTVKVMQTKIAITNELIAQKNGEVKVRLKNLTGKFYRKNNGEYELTASCESVEVIA